MLKKVSIVGGGVALITISTVMIAAAALGSYSVDESVKETEPVVNADVIMPTKVSRPGCEKADRCYVPSEMTVEKGRAVTWLNEDSAFHSVTSGLYDAPTELFDSGHLGPSESFSYTFAESGVYDYYCTLHPWMEAQVMVVE